MKEVRIQNYLILNRIGKGGEGAVYKAYDENLKQYVVLKRLNSKISSSSYKRKEVDILKGLNHSNLPHVLNYLETQYGTFTVMNYIEGKTLKQLAVDGVQYTKNDLLRWAKELCGALNYLHTREMPIIHGDIKPSNIMITPTGELYLIDFGISFFLDDATKPGYTPGFSSPEQYYMTQAAQGAGCSGFSIDHRTDIYSLGATLYYLATGEKHTDYNEPLDIETLEDILGIPFAQAIAKAMNNEPSRRFQSAADMLKELEAVNENDARYQNLIKRQHFRTLFYLAMVGVCLIVAFVGLKMHQSAIFSDYKSLTEQQIRYIRSARYEDAEAKGQEAIKLLPREIEAYYWQAESLYEQGQYDSCIDYIQYNIISNERIRKGTESAKLNLIDTYVLLGRSYVAAEESARSVAAFEEAEKLGELGSDQLRSYGIALAADDQLEAAEQKLAEAEEKGANSAEIAYTYGEILYEKKQYTDAAKKFRESIQETRDQDLMQHAYLMLDRIYEETDKSDKRLVVLKKAAKDLSEEYLGPIYERRAALAMDQRDYAEAAKWLRKTDAENEGNWNHFDKLARCYYNSSNWTELDDVLGTMGKIDDPASYRIDMWRAFSFFDQHNYNDGEFHYEKAKSAYDMYDIDGPSDSDMEELERRYDALVQGGYL